MAVEYNTQNFHAVGIASEMDFRYTQAGVAILNFWFTVPQFTKNPQNQQEKEYATEFYATCWRGVAEDLHKAIPDGGWVSINGLTKGGLKVAEPWMDDQTNQMVSCIEITPATVTLAGPSLADGRSGVLDITVAGKALYPELRQTSGGFNVWNAVLYVNERQYRNQTEFTDYATKWKLTAWRKLALRLDASVGDKDFVVVAGISPGGISVGVPWQNQQGQWNADLQLTIRDIVLVGGGEYGADEEDGVEETPQQQSGPPRRRPGGGSNGGGQSQPAAPQRRRPSVVPQRDADGQEFAF